MPPTVRRTSFIAMLLVAVWIFGGCGVFASVSPPALVITAPMGVQANAAAPVSVVASSLGAPFRAPSLLPPPYPLTDRALQSEVESIGRAFVATGRNPGLSVALVQRDPGSQKLQAMLLNFGTAAKDSGQAIDSNTVYEIGSITKIFTGILLAEAVQAGRMNLNDSIQSYLPQGVTEPTYEGSSITLVQLATHRSGLPRDPGSDSLSDLYAWLNGFHLSRPPGAEYAYSNLAYALLGDILARGANADYGQLVVQSVSQPLGLMDTVESLSDDQASRLAQGYSYDGSPASYFPESGALSGAGYLHSTLNDMKRFVMENMDPDLTTLSGSLLLAQQVESQGPGPRTGTGLGWEVESLGTPEQRMSKGGVTLGFSSYVSISSDRSSGLVLLSNGQHVDSLAARLIQLLRDRNRWLQTLPPMPGGRR